MLLHDHQDFDDLLAVVSREQAIDPGLVEKDYWINRAFDVPCYEPGYTLVEKLQTISTKFRRHLEDRSMPQNFLRHYYDVYCLLGDADVQAFIGTEAHAAHKNAHFPAADNKIIAENPAFDLSDQSIWDRFARAYAATSALYYHGQPSLDDILGRIQEYADRL